MTDDSDSPEKPKGAIATATTAVETNQYREFSTNVIPQVSVVRLYEETITKVKTGHPEVPITLPSMEDAVENAVKNPTHVEKSYSNSYVYVDANSTNVSGDPMRVPVKVVSGTSARVKSIYFASTNSTDNVIWRRSDGA